MATSSVHLPEELLEGLDRLARQRNVSRNRLIVEACRNLVEADLGAWPEGFFDRAVDDDLDAAGRELETHLSGGRRDRSRPPF